MAALRLVTDGENFGFEELTEAEELEARKPEHPEFPVYVGEFELCGSVIDGEYVPDPEFVAKHQD